MRFPRFFAKKRGHRRTDSQAWGAVAEGCFYASLLVAGIVFGSLLVSGAVYPSIEAEAARPSPAFAWWVRLLTLLIPLALVAFGGAGLVRVVRGWGKSQERRAVATRRSIAEGLGGADGGGVMPGVPPCDDLENSPGTVLRYRLPLESPENWSLAALGLFALLWNAIVVVLAVGVGADLLRGTTDRILVGLLVPFVAVGIGGVVSFVRAAALAASVGPTHLEIAEHPLLPGRTYDVLLGQGGASPLRQIELVLELEETASFHQGTDTRTERLVVRRVAVAGWRGVQPVPGGSFEARVALTIPPDAMHSFMSENNAVRWRIVVRATPDRWPAFIRNFPVVVIPQSTAACPPVPEGHQ